MLYIQDRGRKVSGLFVLSFLAVRRLLELEFSDLSTTKVNAPLQR